MQEGTITDNAGNSVLFTTERTGLARAIVIYFWVVIVWLEGRTVQIISWQFVVSENGGQDTSFPFILSSS